MSQPSARDSSVYLPAGSSYGRSWLSSAQRAEAVAEFLYEQSWLFKGRKMTAAIEFVPMNEIGIDALGQAPWCGHDFAREDAATHGNGDHGRSASDAGIFQVHACRGGGRLRQPVERDGVEHLLAGQGVFGISPIVRPGLELLVDPGRLPHRRIC